MIFSSKKLPHFNGKIFSKIQQIYEFVKKKFVCKNGKKNSLAETNDLNVHFVAYETEQTQRNGINFDSPPQRVELSKCLHSICQNLYNKETSKHCKHTIKVIHNRSIVNEEKINLRHKNCEIRKFTHFHVILGFVH